MEPVHHPHRHRRAAAPLQCRHRPDHPGRVPQARHPHRLRGRPVLGLAPATRRSCSTPSRSTAARCSWPGPDFGTGSLARARRLGADGLRLPRGDLRPVRRHLPRQLRQGRPAGRARWRSPTSSCSGSCWRTSPAPRSRSTWSSSTVQAADLTVRVRDRRLHPLAAAGGPRRHRPDAAPRRRDRRLRGRAVRRRLPVTTLVRSAPDPVAWQRESARPVRAIPTVRP